MTPKKRDFEKYEPSGIDLGDKKNTHSLLVALTGSNKKVLEIGTSTGYISKILKEKGNTVIGIEKDKRAASRARSYCDQMVVGDIEELDLARLFKPSSFDVVMLGDVLEHLRCPFAVLKKIKRYLKRDGYLVVSLPNIAHGDVILNLMAGRFRYTETGLLDHTHLRFFCLEEIIKMFDQSGFVVTDIQQIPVDINDSEVELDLSLFPEELVEFMRRLPSATTYQYVFKAYPKGCRQGLAEVTMAVPDITGAYRQVKDARIAKLEEKVASLERTVGDKDKVIDDILNSRGWRLLVRLYRIRDRLMPPNTLRRRAFNMLTRLVTLDVGGVSHGLPNIYRLENDPYSVVTLKKKMHLPEIDIIIVTHNCSDDIKRCYSSLIDAEYDKKKISLYIVDNGSTDETVNVVSRLSKRNPFKHVDLIRNVQNIGFGAAVNQAARLGGSEYVLVLNPDTELSPDCLNILARHAIADKRAALWEPRQLPYEHPKFYAPLSSETIWASGAAFLIRREVFVKIGGFEEAFFLYCEDVDLSFKVRNEGMVCRYVPRAVVWHYSYAAPYQIKPKQQFYSIRNNLLIRYRYGRVRDIVEGYFLWSALFLKGNRWAQKGRRLALGIFFSHLPLIPAMIKWRVMHRNDQLFRRYRFSGWDYEMHKKGSFYACRRPAGNKLISVIVRTINRPSLLREALISLANQTYKNFEVIVIEDGSAGSQSVVKEFKERLAIRYCPIKKKIGRCKAGNKGLKLAKGEYINFLDDDDIFYADHLETLAAALDEHPNCKVAYSACYEAKVKLSAETGLYQVVSLHPFFEQFDRVRLGEKNRHPIQAVMFHRSLYEQYGGFDEQLEFLEDWDLWLRYSRATDFIGIPKATSEFRTPAAADIYNQRRESFDAWRDHVIRKNSAAQDTR